MRDLGQAFPRVDAVPKRTPRRLRRRDPRDATPVTVLEPSVCTVRPKLMQGILLTPATVMGARSSIANMHAAYYQYNKLFSCERQTLVRLTAGSQPPVCPRRFADSLNPCEATLNSKYLQLLVFLC